MKLIIFRQRINKNKSVNLQAFHRPRVRCSPLRNRENEENINNEVYVVYAVHIRS